jgi:hypothetical protein
LGKAAKEMSQRLAVLISALTTILLSSCCPGLISTAANKIPQDNFSPKTMKYQSRGKKLRKRDLGEKFCSVISVRCWLG